MFGSTLLDIAIGLIFVYLLLSLICSSLNEIIEANLKNRATDLERGLRELLHDNSGTGLVKRLYDHPLVCGLFQDSYDPSLIRKGRYPSKTKLPSYVPARNFALALMDIVLPGQQSSLSGAAGTLIQPSASSAGADAAYPLKPLRNAISTIKNPQVEQALMILVDAAGNDVHMVRENIEAWYNSSMERVVGWYKRRAQLIIFFLGLVVTIAVNADTIGISTSLSYDKPMRDSLVAAAQEYAKQQSPTDKPDERIKQNMEEIHKLGLPLGWNESNPLSMPNTFVSWLLKIVGWLITAVAISLGAPFWFDLLKKFMVVRTSINPIEKRPNVESSGSKNGM